MMGRGAHSNFAAKLGAEMRHAPRCRHRGEIAQRQPPIKMLRHKSNRALHRMGVGQRTRSSAWLVSCMHSLGDESEDELYVGADCGRASGMIGDNLSDEAAKDWLDLLATGEQTDAAGA